MQQIGPLRIGENLREVLEADLAGEVEAQKYYSESRDICRAEGDYVSMALFEDLVKDEEGHVNFLDSQLDLLDSIGEQLYGQLQAEATTTPNNRRLAGGRVTWRGQFWPSSKAAFAVAPSCSARMGASSPPHGKFEPPFAQARPYRA